MEISLGWKLKLLLIALFAFLVRVPSLGRPLLTFEELDRVFWGARRVGNFDPDSKAWGTQDPSLVIHAPMPYYYYGSWAKIGRLFGASGYAPVIWWARMGGVLLSILSISLAYLLGKELFGEKEGTIAAVILAFLPLVVGWSRIAYAESPLLFAYLLAFYIFFKTKDWETIKRILTLGLVSGITFSTKYTGIVLIPILGALWVLYSKKSLVQDTILKGRYDLNKRLSQFLDFSVISGILLSISLLFLILIFPFLWKGPISGFLWMKNSLSDGSNSLILFTLVRQFVKTIPKFIFYWIVKIPVLILILTAIGLYLGLKKKKKEHIFLFLWLIVPFSLAVIPIHSSIKYKFPAIGALAIFASLGLLNILETKWMENLFEDYTVPLLALTGYLTISLILCLPYPVGGYFNELVGFGSGAYSLRKSGLDIMPVPGRDYGAGEAYNYVRKNAPKGSTVQLYTTPNPFYIEMDKSLNYTHPTKPPKAQYVLLNSHYALTSDKPVWWYRNSNQSAPEKDLSLNYQDLEEDPNYKKIWSTGALMGTPISAVYKRRG